jgi:hypothetical protein
MLKSYKTGGAQPVILELVVLKYMYKFLELVVLMYIYKYIYVYTEVV